MRRAWWRNERPKLGRQDEALLLALRASSAAAWLDNHFESERLKAALAFDALGANVSLLEPGSGLALLWRAAQEMCGLQGATAIPRRGTAQLVHLLAEAATNAGVALRSGARVERILVDADGVAGVALAGGETLDCRQVISTLSEETTLLGLAADAVPFGRASHLAAERARTGTASFAFALGENPNFQVLDGLGNARIVIADSLETHVTAQAAARNGMLPDELPVEALLISASDDSVAPPEKHVLCATVRPVPAPDAAWTTLAPRLEARTLSTLDRFAPGLVPKIVESHASTPRERGGCVAASPSHVLASWHDRIVTPVPGLYLAGADAEPVAALSGRAGRIAAEIVSAA
jgi:phytoene dehydrogenase-like protein